MKYKPRELHETRDASRGESGWRDQIKLVVSAAAVCLAVYFGLGFVSELVATYVPSEIEARLVIAAPEAEKLGNAERERIAPILHALLATGRVRELDYRIRLLDEPQPNAFAVPGGSIIVTRGLLDEIEGEAGLAMILAHELGHHHHRHALRRLGRGIVLQLASALVLGASEVGGTASQLLAFAELGYSREQEREADRFALSLVHDAYGSTDGALELFENLAAKESKLERWLAFTSTHPLSAERVEDLRRQAAKLDSISGEGSSPPQ